MTDPYVEIERNLPIVIARSEVPRLLGNLISAGRLANLDSEGSGPPKVRLGRKVGYLRGPFIAWMRARGGQTEAKG